MAPRMADLLYRRLFEIAPHLRALFPADLTEQKEKLVTMLALAILNLHRIEEIVPAVEDLARRHVTYGVTEVDYKPVGEALMWTLEEALGDQFTPAVRSAWLAAYGLLSGVMISAAAEPQPARKAWFFLVFRQRAA
jgi:hemoglobin-like flavoprotein